MTGDGRRPFRPAWKTFALAAGVALVGATIAILPPRAAGTRTVVTRAEGDRGTAATVDSRKRVEGRAGRVVQRGGLQCAAGRNGGSTDVGVSDRQILLGATVVDSGVGASFLRDARYGMLAVKNKINRAGGVCGRGLEMILIDDGWDFALGAKFIKNLVEDKKIFALSVVPSSEGLRSVSDQGYLQDHKIPVIGSDGMLVHQYRDPYIWPVAASTISTMHIMVKYAYDHLEARDFGLVYERSYRFGKEGAYAFNKAVRKLTGDDVPGYEDPTGNQAGCRKRFCGIEVGDSYEDEQNTFNGSCAQPQDGKPPCDFVGLLLEPSTALSWMTGSLVPTGNRHMAGPQPLFTREFAEQCGQRCHNMWLWTGYDPPIGGNLGRPAIREYVGDIKSTSTSADYNNTFVEGAYVGMNLLVEALKRVGPNVTRRNLASVLDDMTFESGLTGSLTWRTGDHFANVRMRGYSIQFKDRFSGWRDERAVITDPWVGQNIPPSS